MYKKILTLLLAAVISPNFFFAQKTDDWIFKNEKEGVKVYYRKASDSDMYELKFITSLNVRLSGIIMLFSEVENYHKWSYRLSEARELQKVSEWETYYYSRIDFPWPLDDRDLIVHSRMEQDPISGRITTNSIAQPDYLPTKKGVVRMRKAQYSWTLVPAPSGWTYVEYYISSDPGGNLPDWLVNMAFDVGPLETIKSIRKMVRQEKYQSAKLAYLKD